MAESYDIDDILNELKQRREKESNNEKATPTPNETADKAEGSGAKSAETADYNIKNIEKAEEPSAPEQKAAKPEPEIKSQIQNKAEPEIKSQIQKKAEPEAEKKPVPAAEPNENGEVDLFALAEKLDGEEEHHHHRHHHKEKFHKTKKGKIVITVICVILALIIAAGVIGALYINGMLNMVTDNGDEKPPVNVEQWHGMDELREDFTPILEEPRSEISNFSDMVRTWYYTGKPASSTHVLNVLLIGEDTRGDEIAEEGFRADSAIIASINKDTGKIILTSILRDAYVYYEIEEGNRESGKFSKINEAMSYGGLDCYIRAVENNYKVNIDNYVLVNFASFETIIDTLGGIDLTITSREIKEINSHQKRYGNVTIQKSFDGTEGTVHLNGKQALAYCRIRKIDSDGMRANRQKIVLSILLEKARESSMFKSAEIVTKLIPYVKTGVSKQEIIDLATYAIKNDWIKYEAVSYNVPEDFIDEATGETVKLAVGGTYKGTWVWRADLPLSAQVTQERIYGKTSVTLNENRPKFQNLA